MSGHFLRLPPEFIDSIVSLVDESDLTAVAYTCRTLQQHTQLAFRSLVLEKLDRLWEILEGAYYPDRPATWYAPFPTGFVPPEMPYGLQSEGDETELWKHITDENPEMQNIGAAVNVINFLRRDSILGPHRARLEWSVSQWKGFRTQVQYWICCVPADDATETQAWDWVRLWHLCNPTTTSFPGLRNRARIWADCQLILDLNARLREQGNLETIEIKVREVLSSNRVQWWKRAKSKANQILMIFDRTK